MRVLLMSEDADFAPDPTLSEKRRELIDDLELEELFDAMADGDDFIREVAATAVLTSLSDPKAVEYRQAALRDCARRPDVIRALYELPLTSIELKRERWLGFHGKSPSSILSGAVKMLEMFLDLLRKLAAIAEAHSSSFESPAFTRFFDMIRTELNEEYLAEIAARLKDLRFQDGVQFHAGLGEGNEIGSCVLSLDRDGGGWFKNIFSKDRAKFHEFKIAPMDSKGATALAELRDEGLSGTAALLAKAASHIDTFFDSLRLELAFHIGCLNLLEKLRDAGMDVCFPDIPEASGDVFNVKGLYDPCLALTTGAPVVPNDLAADGKRLVVITGANQGGKSTFLRAVGVAKMMTACGMFAPAAAMSAALPNGIFTHFKRGEDSEMRSGKLDEELSRMNALVDLLRPGSLLLMNESFSSTNEREGSKIAGEILAGLTEQGVRVFYVTHFFELASVLRETKSEEAMFLRSDRTPDGGRSFKLLEAPPLRTSFAKDIYDRVFKSE